MARITREAASHCRRAGAPPLVGPPPVAMVPPALLSVVTRPPIVVLAGALGQGIVSQYTANRQFLREL